MRENADQNNSECGHFLRSSIPLDETHLDAVRGHILPSGIVCMYVIFISSRCLQIYIFKTII